MRTLKKQLLDYMETLTGARPDLEGAPKTVGALPLFLRHHYTFLSGNLFGRHYLLALQNALTERQTPGDFAAHASALQAKLGAPVVMVLPEVASYDRKRLIRLGVPFICPGKQAFLPPVMIDLRERSPQAKRASGEQLTPTAQLLLLYHLQRAPLDELSLQQIAAILGCSAMMISKAKSELVAAGLCEPVREGRFSRLRFLRQGRELWEHALPSLASPVRKNCWISMKPPVPPYCVAGLSALSQRSMISDDRLPTFACSDTELNSFVGSFSVIRLNDSMDALARLEIWAYDPQLLAKDSIVDSLSLFLSLGKSPDERIQQQLAILLEEMSW